MENYYDLFTAKSTRTESLNPTFNFRYLVWVYLPTVHLE